MAKNTRKKIEKNSKKTTLDRVEVDQFDSLGESWWDENGPMRPLHLLNPVRLSYLRDRIVAHYDIAAGTKPLAGLDILDIGCGGGLVTEPLCRLGAAVTGIDAGAENIRVAQHHAKTHNLDIDYRATTAEALAATGRQFDVVTALEIIEHVADVPLFIDAVLRLVKPDGIVIFSTLNRTAKSFVLGIVAAEYILRWLPAGTHDWHKFLKPSEIAAALPRGFTVTDVRGLVYKPLDRTFVLSEDDMDVNYFLTAVKKQNIKK